MGRKRRNNQDLHAVFSLKPIKGTSTAILKCVGHVNGEGKICDEPLVCNDGKPNEDEDNKYVYKITDTVNARFYHCNIRDSYVMISRTLPVLYASIMYQTELLCGLLFDIFVDFVIKSEIKSEKQLINTNLDGKYQLRIKISDKDVPKIIDLDSFDSIKFVIEMIKTLIETDEMKSIIAKLMEERRKERLEKMGSVDEEIDIPKPKYNFTELVKQYKRDGKIDLSY